MSTKLTIVRGDAAPRPKKRSRRDGPAILSGTAVIVRNDDHAEAVTTPVRGPVRLADYAVAHDGGDASRDQ